jgi:hypothetical protein
MEALSTKVGTHNLIIKLKAMKEKEFILRQMLKVLLEIEINEIDTDSRLCKLLEPVSTHADFKTLKGKRQEGKELKIKFNRMVDDIQKFNIDEKEKESN